MVQRRSSRSVLCAGLSSCIAACGPCAPEGQDEVLALLARAPDALFEQPGPIVPRGDLPETATFGPHEGPGWSQTLLRTADGRAFLETNQPRAALVLPATRPVDRELELELWCSRPAGDEPGTVDVRLNGISLTPAPLALSREPRVERIHAPRTAWGLGENELELVVPAHESAGQRWDTLALARVAYGPEVRVRCDLERQRAELPDGAGVRYGVAPAGAAELRVSGTGDGTLRVRLGEEDPRTGAPRAIEEHALESRAGRLEGRWALPRVPRASVELEWAAASGASAVLERLEVVEERGRPRPPIVFLSIDTFAARHLSLHGYARETSPHLEELARDAVVFERCNANAPWTMPSYLSVLTGLYPRSHKVELSTQEAAALDNWDWWQVAENRWTLAEALRGRGYRTAAFVDTQWLTPHYGVDQGFDLYDGQAALAPFSDTRAGIELIVEQLVPPWLAKGPAGVPAFLFVHALDAHGPYWPEPPYRDAFHADLPADRRPTAAGSVNETYGTVPSWMARTLVPDERDPVPAELPLEDIIARYDETLLKVDGWLGKLFELLRARGLYEDAVIVVTGDHGESFGPQAYGHGIMRGEVLHVPLILKLPRGEHAGRRVAAPVQLVDLFPTLLELAGANAQASQPHGTSLLSLLEAEEPPAERPLFSEGGHVEQYSLEHGGWRLVELRPGSESGEAALLTHPRVPSGWLRENFPELVGGPLSEKLLAELRAREGYARKIRELRELLSTSTFELYDVARDPGETRDLAAERADVVARLRPLLEQEKERSRAAARDANPDIGRRTLDPAALAELEKLGYGGQ